MTTKVRILVDNFPDDEHKEWESEHGLSILIEQEGKRILCDMGASSLFWDNAEKMNCDLRNVTAAFVSHGHNDHSGGLKTFLERNGETPVYLSPRIFEQHYFSSRRGGKKRDISTDHLLKEAFQNRLKAVTGSTWLTPTVAMVKTVKFDHDCPKGNLFLTSEENGKEGLDVFTHELALAFVTGKGLIIVSSCSHNGALNIMDSCRLFTGVESVRAFIGGLHLVDSNQVEEEVRHFLADKHKDYPDTLVYTGHCTGVQAREFLAGDEHVRFFHTGTILDFE